MLAGLHKPTERIVVTLLNYAYPIQAIVRAYGFTAGATPQSGTGPDHQLMGGIGVEWRPYYYSGVVQAG